MADSGGASSASEQLRGVGDGESSPVAPACGPRSIRLNMVKALVWKVGRETGAERFQLWKNIHFPPPGQPAFGLVRHSAACVAALTSQGRIAFAGVAFSILCVRSSGLGGHGPPNDQMPCVRGHPRRAESRRYRGDLRLRRQVTGCFEHRAKGGGSQNRPPAILSLPAGGRCP